MGPGVWSVSSRPPSSRDPSSEHWFSNSQPDSKPYPSQGVKTLRNAKPVAETLRRRGKPRQNRQLANQIPKSKAPTQLSLSVCVALPTGTRFCFLSDTTPSEDGADHGWQFRTDKRHPQKPRCHLLAGTMFQALVEGGVSVGGGQETRGGFGVPSDVGQSLRGRVNAPGRDLMKIHNAWACVPQRGPRGSVGVMRDWIRMLGGKWKSRVPRAWQHGEVESSCDISVCRPDSPRSPEGNSCEASCWRSEKCAG